MAASKRESGGRKKRRPPAKTPEGRELQLIDLAVDLAEQQLERGTASAQVITHYLRLGTTRERLEQERLRNDNLLTQAKIQALSSAERTEELYRNALKAMATYSGHPEEGGADEEPVLYRAH